MKASVLSIRITKICGATIIDASWILTAAHCIESHILVETGTGIRHVVGNVHRVNRTIVHDDFDASSKHNDIALIELVEPIQFNNKQHPVELAKPHGIPKEGEMMRISGFGKIGQHLDISDALKAAYVPVVSQENCQRYFSQPITHKMFCAGNEVAGMCYGDSGGPGVIGGKLHGIISFGNEHSWTLLPGVYTAVNKYYDWIVEKTGIRF